jgi:hypothetical protein
MNTHQQEAAWLSWSELTSAVEGKKLVFFGRGEWMEKTIPYLAASAAYVVDNNPYEQGQQEAGLTIFAPDKLREEEPDSVFIIIATSGFLDVIQQLQQYGFRPGTHYCVSPSLKNFHVVSRIDGHRQVVHFTCSDRRDENNPHRGGGLYSYDLQTRAKEKLIDGMCHGAVVSKDRVFLVDDTVGLRIMSTTLSTLRTIELPPKSRPHGIAYCPGRERVYVTFSGRDSIGEYDVKTGESLREIRLSAKFERSGVAQHHVNDLYVHGDYLYVSMFSHSGNWKIGLYDGCILQFDLETGECMGPAVSNLWMPHTPVVINGTMYFCDSMRGVVSDSTWRILTRFNGFVRGISHDGSFFYIGQSTHRYIDRREGTTDNISLDTGIFLVDPVHKVTKFFSMPELSDINSLLIVR